MGRYDNLHGDEDTIDLDVYDVDSKLTDMRDRFADGMRSYDAETLLTWIDDDSVLAQALKHWFELRAYILRGDTNLHTVIQRQHDDLLDTIACYHVGIEDAEARIVEERDERQAELPF